jgi:hypothetical protein
MFNIIRKLEFKDIYNKISFANSGFFVFNLAWGILLFTPIPNESNLLLHLLIFTLKVNILSLVIEMIISIIETISLLKRNDWNEKYRIEPEIYKHNVPFYGWKDDIAMRAAYSCVCILLTFAIVN